MSRSRYEPGAPVIYQGTLKATVVRQQPDGQVIVAFGAGTQTKLVSPITLVPGTEIEVMEKL